MLWGGAGLVNMSKPGLTDTFEHFLEMPGMELHGLRGLWRIGSERTIAEVLSYAEDLMNDHNQSGMIPVVFTMICDEPKPQAARLVRAALAKGILDRWPHVRQACVRAYKTMRTATPGRACPGADTETGTARCNIMRAQQVRHP